VSEDEEDPLLPTLQDTALGEAPADLLEWAAKPWIDNSRCEGLENLRDVIDDKLKE
jgi:hypothetical protein